MDRRAARLRERRRVAVPDFKDSSMLSLPVFIWLPELQQDGECGHRRNGADDIHQPGAVKIGDKELRNGEGDARGERRRPDAEHAAKTGEARNREVIASLAGSVGIPVQAGGGVRDYESAVALLRTGVPQPTTS